jgi:uncharacterized protein (DUF1778 family)
MATAKKKISRVDLRVSPEDKKRLQMAVDFTGERVTDFIMRRIMPDVNRILEAEKQIVLNDEAWSGFISMLQASPKKANPKLKKAMVEYLKLQET